MKVFGFVILIIFWIPMPSHGFEMLCDGELDGIMAFGVPPQNNRFIDTRLEMVAWGDSDEDVLVDTKNIGDYIYQAITVNEKWTMNDSKTVLASVYAGKSYGLGLAITKIQAMGGTSEPLKEPSRTSQNALVGSQTSIVDTKMSLESGNWGARYYTGGGEASVIGTVNSYNHP